MQRYRHISKWKIEVTERLCAGEEIKWEKFIMVEVGLWLEQHKIEMITLAKDVAAESLSRLSCDLDDLVGRFKV